MLDVVIAALCPLVGAFFAVAVIYGCEARAGVQRPTRVQLDEPNPPLACDSTGSITTVVNHDG